MAAAVPVTLTLTRPQAQLLLRAAYVVLIYAGSRRTRDPEFRQLEGALAALRQLLAGPEATEVAA